MKAIGRCYRAYSMDQPDLYMLIFGGKAIDRVAVQDESGQSAFSILLQTAADAISSGEFVPAPPLGVTVSCWSLVHGFVMLELAGFLNKTRDVEGGDAGELFEASLSVIENGYLNR